MKILICGMNYAPEPIGIGKYTAEMAEWFAGKGHDLRVIASYPYYPDWKIPEGYSQLGYQKQNLNGVTVFRCPVWIPRKISAAARMIHLLSFAASSLPLLLCQALCWRPKTVIVVAPNFLCSFGGWLAARMCGARALLHLQDLELEIVFAMKRAPRGWLYRTASSLERWMLRRFDGISTISEAMAERLKKKKIAAEKLSCFANWVDENTIFPMKETSGYRRKWHIPAGARVALYSGSMGKKHGLEIIVEAARILSKHPGIRFILCGNGAVRASLEEKAGGLQNIFFYDLQTSEDLNELLNLADIHLLPQRSEFSELLMPSKLTGIFASGRPVVVAAAASGSLAQTAQQGGRVTPPGDAKAFAEAILYLADNDTERIRLGGQARAYAVQCWSKEKILTDFEKSCLEKSGAKCSL